MDSREKLRLASLVAGILSLALMLFGLGLPAGALGILFALLSRDNEPVSGRARTGMILSIIGMVIGVLILVSSIYMITSGEYDRIMEILQNAGY